MYIPDAFSDRDPNVLRDFIRDHPFATLVSATPSGPLATHLPLDWADGGPAAPGRLLGHVARANPQWRAFDPGETCLAVFHGPHGYISPSWYVSDSLVPTWNYAAVHITGTPRILTASDEARSVLDRLVARFEGPRATPWVNTLEAELMEQLLEAIVVFEMPIARIEGKFKLGQNRSLPDQRASLAGLAAEDGDGPGTLAALTRAHLRTREA